MVDLIGYVIVEYNQASHQPERLADDTVFWDRATADHVANEHRREADAIGRRERYVVAEVHEAEEATS